MSSPHQQSPTPLTPADELARMMREITPESDNDDNNAAQGGGPSLRSSSPGCATDASNIDETEGIPPSSGPVRSNEQRAARRLADKLGLMPYQKDALGELVKVDLVLTT